MSTPVLLNIIGLSLGALGAVFLGMAFIMRNKTIEKLSTSPTTFGVIHNLELKKWLHKSCREGIIGLSLLLIGFIMQIFAQFFQ